MQENTSRRASTRIDVVDSHSVDRVTVGRFVLGEPKGAQSVERSRTRERGPGPLSRAPLDAHEGMSASTLSV